MVITGREREETVSPSSFAAGIALSALSYKGNAEFVRLDCVRLRFCSGEAVESYRFPVSQLFPQSTDLPGLFGETGQGSAYEIFGLSSVP